MSDFRPGAPSAAPPPMMHSGRIPAYKNNHGENFQTRSPAEPPACVQNAMLTKDKKPFTYTPGGLDLSQIKTPSMARRLNKQQRSLEEEDQPYQNGTYNGGGGSITQGQPRGPPAPPPPPPVAPPPPPILIQAPASKSPNLIPGERPEIVIPENPIGMLRKTNSPYHWESELADRQRDGPVPKFVEKSATPSPVQPQMRNPPPHQFTQQPPQHQHFSQEPSQTYPYTQQQQPPIRQFNQVSPQPNQFTHQSPQPNQFTSQSPQLNNYTPQSPHSQSFFKQSPQPQQYLQQSPNQFQQSPPSQQYQQSPQPQSFFQKSPQFSPQPSVNSQIYSPSSQHNSTSESPVWKPEPKYPNPHQNSNGTPRSSQSQISDNISNNTTPIRDFLQRQDSQFNKSPSPYPQTNSTHSPYQQTSPPAFSQNSISPSSLASIPGSPWRQPPTTNSPIRQEQKYSPNQELGYSPIATNFRSSPAFQEFRNSPVRSIPSSQENKYSPTYQNTQVQYKPFTNKLLNIIENTKSISSFSPQPEQPPQYIYNKVEQPPQRQATNQPADSYSNVAPWRNPQHVRQENPHNQGNLQPDGVRFQSHIIIPVTSKKHVQPDVQLRYSPQKEAVYVTQEPVYYKSADSPKEVPPFVRTKSEKEKTPPPVWCTRPLENRKSVPRDDISQERDNSIEPPWIQKAADMRKNVLIEPAPVQPVQVNNQQPPWSQKPSDNRKSVLRDTVSQTRNVQNQSFENEKRRDSQIRIIPIQMEVFSKEVQRNHGQNPNQNQTYQNESVNPNQMRILMDLKGQPGAVEQQIYPQYSQPQNRITRVGNPQLVRFEDSQPQQNNMQPKTRIIPIQLEPQSPGVNAPKRIYFHQFSQEGPPRQSRSFRVLQTITGTLETENFLDIEDEHGFSDL